ncbi:class I SAM-dependent methyltransferase [Haloimpatiens sp. FM7330]|uniref:class I SAM-dependent methyltransferase n=1 Tax=Haloimpatiens sp. FM7330 TaxID=3298610 RepID=UPI0036397F39
MKSIFENNIEGAKIFLSFLDENSHILDFGCGFGRNTNYLLKKGLQVSISDISERSMEICEENVLRYGYSIHKIQYGERLGCKDQLFDGVVLWSVLDHMTLANAKDTIDEIDRVCKNGSVLLCSFDGEEYINKDMYKENEDRSITFVKGKDKGMTLRFFKNDEIFDLFRDNWEILYFRDITSQCEKVIVCRKRILNK